MIENVLVYQYRGRYNRYDMESDCFKTGITWTVDGRRRELVVVSCEGFTVDQWTAPSLVIEQMMKRSIEKDKIERVVGIVPELDRVWAERRMEEIQLITEKVTPFLA